MAKQPLRKFQYKKLTPVDPYDGHTHEAYYDEDGNGSTTVDGSIPHNHSIYNFKINPAYAMARETGDGFLSAHPGSLAFAEEENKTGCIPEMEIFRAGTHNGDEFTEDDLDEIAANFRNLRDEVRPKLKLTHRENQSTLAGLASYGDITDVYTKKDKDGKRRLYARVENVPKEVMDFVKDRRFPERSIEIYPKFQLGTREDSPVYKNVLKAVALLGHEMPAVSGMAPIALSENERKFRTVCIGEVCFLCDEKGIINDSIEDVAFEAVKASLAFSSVI